MSFPTGRCAPLRLLLAASLLAPVAAAQADVFNPIHIPASNGPRNVTVGDIDGDGLIDVACTAALSVGDTGANVFRNLDGFRLGDPVYYPGGTSALLLADLNADGLSELIQGAGFVGDKITVRINNGDGTFGAPATYVVSQGPSEIHAVDVDEDGVVDLVVACELSLRVSVLIGVGDGSFLPSVNYGPTGKDPSSIALGDLDGDDRLDIVVANASDASITVMLGAGDGSFAAPLPPMPAGPSPEDIALGDFDEDGELDVAVLEGGTGFVHVFFGDGDGTFTGQVTVVITVIPITAAWGEELVLKDFDEDGHLDIAGVLGGLGHVGTASGNGDGTFQPTRFYGTGNAPTSLAAADLNQDGDLDLITGNYFGDDLTLLFGEGDGTFTPTIGTGTDPAETAAADVDADGLLDLVLTNPSADEVWVLIGVGNGRFAPPVAYPAGSEPVTVRIVEVTGDAFSDLLVGSGDPLAPGLHVLPGNGDGTFDAAITQAATLSDIRFMDTADFDGDGACDVVLSRTGIPGLLVYYNDGSGNFTTSDELAQDLLQNALAAVDLDGDLLPDIVVGLLASPGALVVHLNTGSGFAPPILNAVPWFTNGLAVADLNDDTLPDVVRAQSSLTSIDVHFGNGDGTFDTPVTYPATFDPRDVGIGDVDGDGVLDIVVANAGGGNNSTVGVLLGIGDGSFGSEQTIRMASGSSKVIVADLDGDGVDDAVVSVTQSAHVAVLLSSKGPWNVLTNGLAGTHGIPRQIGTGTLIPFEAFGITLRDALENASAALVVGLAELNAPFKGGTMVPDPLLIVFPLVTDATGTLTMADAWPPGASGGTLVLQFWVIDPGGPVGFSASNAVSMTIP